MTLPRKSLVSLDDTPFYHCVSRCVRRAFLCGIDSYSGKSYEHRRAWLEYLLLRTADVFAIRLCAYAVMSNHYHVVLHVRPDIANQWSELEVAKRWHRLFRPTLLSQRFVDGEPLRDVEWLSLRSDIKRWRARLTSISWYMRIVNERIARQANAEDHCTGRFWEGRFKSQALLDERALLSYGLCRLKPHSSQDGKNTGVIGLHQHQTSNKRPSEKQTSTRMPRDI